MLVHGGPGAAGEMAPVAEHLQDNFGIIEAYQTRYTIEDQINELKDIMDNQAVAPALLVGFSWGAWLSIMVTARHPELVNKLVLIGCPPLELRHTPRINETRLSRLDNKEKAEFISLLKLLQKESVADSLNQLKKIDKLVNKTDSYDPIPLEESIEFNPEIFNKIWKQADQLRNAGELLNTFRSIRVPVTCIHGDYDPHPVDGIEPYASEYLENSEFMALKNCGHKPWIERYASTKFYKILMQSIEHF